MNNINILVSKINKEKSSIRRKDAAKRACEYIIEYLKTNNLEADKYAQLKNLAEKLVAYCELYKKNKSLSLFQNDMKQENKGSRDTKNHKIEDNSNISHSNFDSFKIEKADYENTEEIGVIGLEHIQSSLNNSVKLVIEHPELFTGHRKPAKLILLYGPPGTGKTHLVNSLKKLKINMIKVSASDIFSKYQGESEKIIRKLFEDASNLKPCAIFIDEIDFLCKDRNNDSNESSNRIKSELLIRISQIENDNNIFLLGATNFPWAIDAAFLRRFQKKIYLGLPNMEMRVKLFKFFLGRNKTNLTDNDYIEMAKNTEFYSSSDIKQVSERMLCSVIEDLEKVICFIKKSDEWSICSQCNSGRKCDENDGIERSNSFHSVVGKIEEPEVTIKNFFEVMKKCKSSVNKEKLIKYEQWTEKFGEK